jgi:hypothetical protein
MDEKEDDGDDKPDDGQGVEDALGDGFQLSVLKNRSVVVRRWSFASFSLSFWA